MLDIGPTPPSEYSAEMIPMDIEFSGYIPPCEDAFIAKLANFQNLRRSESGSTVSFPIVIWRNGMAGRDKPSFVDCITYVVCRIAHK